MEKKYKVDRLVEEDAVVEELVEVVVVDVRIVVEDLMVLKMQLLVMDAVMRLIEEDVGMGVIELATLVGSGLLMLFVVLLIVFFSCLFCE